MTKSQLKGHPKDTNLTLKNLNLTEAINLICHAGHPDPREDASKGSSAVLQNMIDLLCTLSMHDGLTGLSNRRYFQIALKREVYRASRDGSSCVLLMLDIDHFKLVNDSHGHPAGDIALKTVATRLKQGLRPGDTLSRYGGEEFAVILPNCSLRHARQVAERLRKSVAQAPIAINKTSQLSVTISIGAATASPLSAPDPTLLLQSADDNLYKAKSNGRNQTWSEEPIRTSVSAGEKAALFGNKKKIKRKDPP